MGTAISVDVRDAGVGAAALDAVFAWFQHVDETFSTYKEESQISRLGRGELAVVDCDPDVGFVLERCDEEGIPAYLESSNARNVPFYRRHGFGVTTELQIPGGGPMLWLMWREPLGPA